MIKAEKPNEPVTGSKTKERVQIKQASQKASKKVEVEENPELPPQQRQAVAEIGRIHDDLRAATRLTAAKAIELGERLTQLKEEVEHGQWLKFAKTHLPFNQRTAERYMSVYKHKARLTDKFDSVSHLSLSEAYATLAEPKHATVRDPEEVEMGPAPGASKESQHRNRILTEIQRSVADRLERLSPKLLTAFETDFRSFLESWMQVHREEGQNDGDHR